MVDVYVKLPSGRTSTLALMPTDKVSKIYDHVGKEEGVSGKRVRLKYQGKVVDKAHTIGYLGIRPETILKGEVIFPKTMSIYLKFEDGHTLPMTTQNVDDIAFIKTYINEMEAIPTDQIILKLASRGVLRDIQLLFEAGVGEESIVNVIVSVKSSTPPSPASSNSNIIDDEPPEDLKEDVLASFDTCGKNVEVVFCFDTTGSMSSYLDQVRTNLKDTCTRLLHDIPSIRIGIMAHGDYCDQATYVVRSIDLTSDVDQLVTFAGETPSTCGGDSPECYEWALRKAQQLDWSEHSAKAFVVIGDCEPHPPSYTDQRINWRDELDVLKGMGVKVYGVHCQRGKTASENFYAVLAEETGGCLLKLAHFNLITEMFLAVCYKEAAPEQLEAYTDELEQTGKLTGDTKELMEQLDHKSTEGADKRDRSAVVRQVPCAAWWNISFDTCTTPSYIYNGQEDKWSDYSAPEVKSIFRFNTPSCVTSGSGSSLGEVSTSKKKGRKCVIM